MVEIRREDIEAAKMALKTAMNKNIFVPDTVIQAIRYLAEWNAITGEERYLLSALAIIHAYIELGYQYLPFQKEFDQILKKLKTSYELEFLGKCFPAAEVRATKPQIRIVLGRWGTPRKGDLKIDEVLEDIVDKVKNKECGKFVYRNGNPEKGGKVYELLIDEDVSYLYDKQKDKYYLLVQQEEKREGEW